MIIQNLQTFTDRNPASNPYHRFRTLDEVQAAAAQGIRIDVNQATVDDWLRLPGISIRQARSLVQLAQTGMRFYCLDDLAAALSLPVQQLQPFAPILQFCYYDATSSIAPPSLNVNHASVEQLAQVPEIDLYLARRIVQQRQQGHYDSMADLQQRLALSPQMMANLIHFLSL
jgi:DNA uptake protein ComE-like DNA-binding protein